MIRICGGWQVEQVEIFNQKHKIHNVNHINLFVLNFEIFFGNQF